MDICKDAHWDYIFNLKKNRLKNLYEEFMDNVNYENETSHEGYSLSTNLVYHGHKVCAFQYIETVDNETTIFNYVSNLEVDNYNIKEIVAMGRLRWKIENEGFNEQKNGTYAISHLCSKNENALKIHYLFIQIAHIIRQLLEFGSIVLREMRLKTKREVSQFITTALTSQISNLNDLEKNFQLRFD